MSNSFEPYCSACYNFKKNGGIQRATAWLAPTTITELSDNITLIKWSCSLGKMCEFSDCVYAKVKVSDG